MVKLVSGARYASELVAQKVYHNLGGGGLFEFGSLSLPGIFQISPKLEEHDGCLHLVQSVTFTLFHGGFNAIEARLEAVVVFPVEPQVTTCFNKLLHRTLINKPLVFIRGSTDLSKFFLGPPASAAIFCDSGVSRAWLR